MGQVIALFAASVAYSVARYVVFAPKNLDNLPVLVVNKGVSMAAALAFALGFWHQWRGRTGSADAAATWFRAGLFGSVAHVPMSLVILRPGYFPEFFAGERLSFGGESVFLFGALTAAGIYLLGRTTWTARHRWLLSAAVMVTLLCHTLAMGLARGLNITKSHGYLPPMWLLSLVGVALGLAFLLGCRPRESRDETEGEQTASRHGG